jgi:hypothetical protein
MKAVALIAGQPPFPNLDGLVHAKSFGFRCIEGCDSNIGYSCQRSFHLALRNPSRTLGETFSGSSIPIIPAQSRFPSPSLWVCHCHISEQFSCAPDLFHVTTTSCVLRET